MTSKRVAGLMLLSSVLIVLVGFVVLAVQGDIGDLQLTFKGVEEVTEPAPSLRWFFLFPAAGLIPYILGFSLLTLLLWEGGDRAIAVLALIAILIAAVFMAIEGTFHMSVTADAAEQAARTGSAPEFYEPLRKWINNSIQLVYVVLALVSFAGYGWAMLRTRVLSAWVGWFSISWGQVWLLVFLILRDTLPGVLPVMPLVVGLALVFQRQTARGPTGWTTAPR